MQESMVKIRKWDLSDAPTVAEHANNSKIADNLRDGFPHPYTLKDATSFIQTALSDKTSAHLFAIDLDGNALGSIGAIFKEDVYRMNVEIGYWLAEEFWGKGIVSSAIKLITAYIFDNFEIDRIYAEPFADNVGSCKVLEKSGYSLDARLRRNIIKNGIIKDSLIYSILRSEFLSGRVL